MFSHELKRKENMLHHATDHVKGSQKKNNRKETSLGLFILSEMYNVDSESCQRSEVESCEWSEISADAPEPA